MSAMAMEIGSSDQSLCSIVPSWVILDQNIFRKAASSFRHGKPTSAKTCDSNGDVVRVSFSLRPPPGASRLCVHLPKGRKLSGHDTVVATHGNAVLFRLKINFDGLPSSCPAIDHFIYWASPHGAKISLLPRWYSTEEEIAAAEVGSWRRNPRMTLGRRGTGLLNCDEEDFVVAELHLDLDRLEELDAPLEAQLLRLHSSAERIAAGAGEWEVKHARARGGKAKFGDLHCWWEAGMVIPYTSYLCWIDYTRGIIFCDVNHPSPDLQYVSFPVDHIPVGYPDPFSRGFPQASRAVCVTKNETLKFVNIARSEPGSSFTITISTLHESYNDMRWVTDTTIQAANLWDMEGYDDQLPRVVPQFPLVSMDDPNIMYFVLKERCGFASAKAWVVALNIAISKVLWYKDIKAIPFSTEDSEIPGNIFCNMPFFPTDFSKHLREAAVSESIFGKACRESIFGKATWKSQFTSYLMGPKDTTELNN